MKYINKIFSLFAIALMAVACDPDAESYTPGGLEEGNQGICFAGNYTQTVEVEPGVTSFILTLKRSVTDAAGSVDIKVLNNEENIFICPSTASFAAGEATTTLTVETPSATAGILYNLKLAVSGDNVSEYTSGYNEISVNFSIIKWESIGTGYYLDGTVSTFFGVDPSMPMAVKLERAETATSVRFRFDSPFARVATETVDEYGGYDGYPFNEENDVVPGKYLFTIDVTSQGAALSPVDLGMDWGYGMFSIGSVYGNLSTNIATYPLGTYDEEAGCITFPANSLYIKMVDYSEGAASPCANPSYLYLNGDAYLESLEAAK